MKKLYARKHLADRLKESGLPNNDITLRKYDNKGIIPEADYLIYYQDGYYRRAYSRERIEEIIDAVEKMMHKRKNRRCDIYNCERKHYARGLCASHYNMRHYYRRKRDFIGATRQK